MFTASQCSTTHGTHPVLWMGGTYCVCSEAGRDNKLTVNQVDGCVHFSPSLFPKTSSHHLLKGSHLQSRPERPTSCLLDDILVTGESEAGRNPLGFTWNARSVPSWSWVLGPLNIERGDEWESQSHSRCSTTARHIATPFVRWDVKLKFIPNLAISPLYDLQTSHL